MPQVRHTIHITTELLLLLLLLLFLNGNERQRLTGEDRREAAALLERHQPTCPAQSRSSWLTVRESFLLDSIDAASQLRFHFAFLFSISFSIAAPATSKGKTRRHLLTWTSLYECVYLLCTSTTFTRILPINQVNHFNNLHHHQHHCSH